MSNWKSTLCSRGFKVTRIPAKIREIFCSSNDTPLNEVLLYGAEDEEQRRKVGLNNLYCIYYVLIHASASIDICAPSLTSDTIINSLINVKQKGDIKIRIAIYHSFDCDNLKTFSQYGMEVKVIRPAVHLEHEFILIDALDCADAVAIIGSIDYEVTRVNCNRDSSMITSELPVVSALKREFERVWNLTPDVNKCYNDHKS